MTASFVASHRRRVTLCVHTSLSVCRSISVAISGAPQNAPMAAGTPMSTVPRSRNQTYTPVSSPVPVLEYTSAMWFRLAASATSTTTVAVPASNAWERNWRQASQVTGVLHAAQAFDEWARRIPCRPAPTLRGRDPTLSRPGRARGRWFAPRWSTGGRCATRG